MSESDENLRTISRKRSALKSSITRNIKAVEQSQLLSIESFDDLQKSQASAYVTSLSNKLNKFLLLNDDLYTIMPDNEERTRDIDDSYSNYEEKIGYYISRLNDRIIEKTNATKKNAL